MNYKLHPFQEKHFIDTPHQYYECGTGSGKTIMAFDRWVQLGKPSPILVLAPKSKILSNDWQDLDWGDAKITFKAYHPNNVKGDYEHIILDEAHKIKNFKTKTWKNLKKPKTSTWLSATPTSRGWIDLYPFLSWTTCINTQQLDKRFSIYEKVQKYFSPFPIKELKGYKPDLPKHMYKVFKLIDFPKDYKIKNETVFCKLPNNKVINSIKKDKVLGDKVFESPSAVFHGVRQIENEEKVKFIKELEHKHILIFVNYKSEIKFLTKHLTNCLIVDGSNDYNPNKKAKYLIINYAAGSTGLNLQYATCLVHYSPTCKYIDYKQSQGRIDRIGQKNAIEFFELYGHNDELKMIKMLENKKDINENLFYEEG